MIKIRSSLNGPIEFSVKSGNIKIMRSKIQGKPEFLTEITKKQYDELLADKTGPFKELLKNGDFQVIKDQEDQEDSENRAFSMEELETHASSILEEYKEGEGAELLQSSLESQKEVLEEEFIDKIDIAIKGAVKNAKEVWETESRIKLDEAVKVAAKEANQTLLKKHNQEVASGKLKKWS